MSRAVARLVLAAVAVLFVAAGIAPAQTTTETKNFEVIAVQGNDLVVKLPEGTKQLTVPDDFRFTVDGQQLSVHDLKPGMKGTATVTTRTTLHPVTVTEVKNGTVRQVSGPTIIVQTAEGYKMFTEGDVDKRGVKIMRNGQPAELSDFRAGDKLSATIITEMPPRAVTEKEVSATLARAESGAASAPPKAHAAAAPSSAPMEPAAEAKHLPKTASTLPLVGLVGLTSLLAGAGLTLRRRLAR